MSRAEEIAEELIGTDKVIDDVTGSHERENWGLMEELQEYALKCDSCGFWFEPEEMDTTDGDCTCGECSGDA